MKIIILQILSAVVTFHAFSQGKVVTVLNDSTELRQFDDGQQLKVSYLLNGTAISINEKEKLLANEVYVQQEFNIKTVAKEIVGEVNLLLPDSKLFQVPAKSLNILKNVKGISFPVFSWTDISGNKLSLAGLAGKTVVFNFWHTSCVPCIAEMPLLNELAKQYTGRDVVFIASTPNNVDQVKQFLKKTVFTYNQVAGVEPGSVFDPFPGWPIHIVLNGNGIIKFHALGKQKDIEQKLVKAINEALAENK